MQCRKAAFAINQTTGKGVLVMMETRGDAPIFTTFHWKKQSIEQTPLADWKQKQLADFLPAVGIASPQEDGTTTASMPNFPTSFDCSKAHSDAEHLICGNAKFAAADVELAAVYAKAKVAVLDQTALRARIRAQGNYREQTCHDRKCLTRWYTDQRTALNEIATTGTLGP